MASISDFSKMRFIEVLQAQMKRPRPENTSALLIIVPYARPASESPISVSAPWFWPGVQQTRNRTRFAAPIDHPFKYSISV
jgi:hypothetical protein